MRAWRDLFVGCDHWGSSMPDRDPATLLHFITSEIWCKRRYDLIDDLISDDFVDHVEAQGLEGSGRARYLASAQMVHEAFSDYHEEPKFTVADQEKAVSYARVTGTHDGDLMGLPPTGRKIDVHTIGIRRFVDGQVVERWGIGDSLTQMQQLGVLG
jgi:predicted ester cyclase